MLKKTWGSRFTTGADPTAERFTASLDFDRRLWPQDIAGSMAWARVSKIFRAVATSGNSASSAVANASSIRR